MLVTLSGPVFTSFWYKHVALICNVTIYPWMVLEHKKRRLRTHHVLALFTTGIIDLRCCNFDGMTNRECTNASYQITRLHVRTCLSVHCYHHKICAIKHFKVQADKCICTTCGNARVRHHITVCNKKFNALWQNVACEIVTLRSAVLMTLSYEVRGTDHKHSILYNKSPSCFAYNKLIFWKYKLFHARNLVKKVRHRTLCRTMLCVFWSWS
jgi:hypothetical protein